MKGKSNIPSGSTWIKAQVSRYLMSNYDAILTIITHTMHTGRCAQLLGQSVLQRKHGKNNVLRFWREVANDKLIASFESDLILY